MSSHDPYCNIIARNCRHCGKRVYFGAHSCLRAPPTVPDSPKNCTHARAYYQDFGRIGGEVCPDCHDIKLGGKWSSKYHLSCLFRGSHEIKSRAEKVHSYQDKTEKAFASLTNQRQVQVPAQSLSTTGGLK